MQRLVLPSVEAVLEDCFDIVLSIVALTEDVAIQFAQSTELLPSVEEPRENALFFVSPDAHAARVLEHQVVRALFDLVDNLLDVVFIELLVAHECL